MRYFLAIVDHGSVHRAAQELFVAQPSVSQAVSPLAPMITRYRAEYPLVEVVVRAAGTPPEVAAAVRAGDAELGMLGTPGLGPELAGLTVHQLETQAFVLVAATEADLPAGEPVSTDALAGQRLIVGQPGTGLRRVADDILRRSRGSRIAVEIEHREAVLPLVLGRVGVAVLSESWRELAGAAVRDLACDEVLRVCLVHREGRLSPAAAAFLPR